MSSPPSSPRHIKPLPKRRRLSSSEALPLPLPMPLPPPPRERDRGWDRDRDRNREHERDGGTTTKKRKVPQHGAPLARSASPMPATTTAVATPTSPPPPAPSTELATRLGMLDVGAVGLMPPLAPATTYRNRSSRATLAGLSLKSLVRARKRQLGAVLGALETGDGMALEEALRRADRNRSRAQRQRRRRLQRPAGMGPGPAVPSGEFTFECGCATSERLVKTREEVAVLQQRFEAELARQSALAKRKAASGVSAARSASMTTTATATPTKKKKARNSGTKGSPTWTGAAGGGGSFLSAGAEANGALAGDGEEWICPKCEYALFWGREEGAFRKAIRGRKKILRRRRRARERAVAATTGRPKEDEAGREDVDEYDDGMGSEDVAEMGSVPPSGHIGRGPVDRGKRQRK